MHAFPAPTPRSSLERRGSAGCAMQGRSPAARRRARWGVVVLIGWGLGACNGGETLGGPPLAGFAAVAAGAGFACGATPSGVAYCWGDGWYGQLGTGATQTNSTTPVPVAGGLTFTALTAGSNFACAVTPSGTAYCWGGGQLGNGSTAGSATHVAVSGGLAFTTVSVGAGLAGGGFACVLTTVRAAYCWGDNIAGELGIGTTTGPQNCFSVSHPQACSTTPVAVAGGLTFRAISAGSGFACGVTTSGAAYCWGANPYGQLGTGTTTGSATPVTVAGGLSFRAVSAGGGAACGVTPSSTAYCWGMNSDGQLGTGTTAGSATPVAVAGGLAFTTVSAGHAFACGVTTSGTAQCWGVNTFGQLGTGTTTGSATPATVGGGLSFATVSAGDASACGVTTSGAAYCWGVNVNGNLGTGTSTGTATPAAVAGGLSFSEVSAGDGSACGVTTSGAAYCWGNGSSGQLGTGTRTSSSTPLGTLGGLGITAVSAGGGFAGPGFAGFACGVTTSGVAYCWGANTDGQLGTGSIGGPALVPTRVAQ